MSKILNLVNYELILTTSFENMHGVSGHLYEMIDYYYITKLNNINVAILLTDGTTIDTFKKAVIEKYNFSSEELDDLFKNTIECSLPKLIRTHNICIVDGAPRFNDCSIIADNMFLLRCQCNDFSYFKQQTSIKNTYLLQDYNLYDERTGDLPIVPIDYVKKILWNKYYTPKDTKTNTALLYLTTNCRALPVDTIKETISRFSYSKYLILTNDTAKYQSIASSNVTVQQAPVKDIFDQFDVYIYTSTPNHTDCSPRFIVECAVFGKEVVYDIDYVDRGIECRKAAIKNNLLDLHLNIDDEFVNIIKDKMHVN